MANVTTKLEVTLPETTAGQYDVHPGEEIAWAPADDRATKLRMFDQATERHRRRRSDTEDKPPRDRGWTREDLYGRGRHMDPIDK